MKLKRSYWVSLLLTVLILFSNGCTSIPGKEDNKITNIYIEYLNIGDIYFNLEKYNEAIPYYKLAMQNKKVYWGAYYKLAKCYVYTSNWNNALSMYKKLLNKDKENNSLKANIAYIYLMQGNFNKAEFIYSDLLLKEPDNKAYLENYLALLLSNDVKIKQPQYLEKYNSYLAVYQEKYPDDENLNKFKLKYEQIFPPENSESENQSEENIENANADSSSQDEKTEFTDKELYGEEENN